MAQPPQETPQDILAEDIGDGQSSKPGTDLLNPFPPVVAILIDPGEALSSTPTAPDSLELETAPDRLPSVAYKARPSPIPASHHPPTPPKDAPSAIFLPDDRQIYQDSSYPFSCIGKVRTATSTSSGTLVGPRHMLTASHCVNWTRDPTTGNIGWMSFTPSYFDGRGPWGEFFVTHTIAYRENGNRMSDEDSAWDMALCILSEPINTKVGGTIGTKTYRSDWNGGSYWSSFGYPGDMFNAERPEFQPNCVVSSTEGFGDAQLLGHFNDTFFGQSGGPVWGTWDGQPGPQIVGILSTTPDVPKLGSRDGDNQYAGGKAMVELVKRGLRDFP
jgi:V8-like Glu-specific endopeptidase